MQPAHIARIQLSTPMKFGLQLVAMLLLCSIVVVVYSPFVDLPLTTLPSNHAAAHFQQMLWFTFSLALAFAGAWISASIRLRDKMRASLWRLHHDLLDLNCCYVC
jgi:hypothetical protein